MESYVTLPGMDYLAYANSYTRDFTARDQIIAAIDTWLRDPAAPRTFLLSGVPGSGKTALASQLFHYAMGRAAPPPGSQSLGSGFLSGVFFCSARDARWINPHVFTETLALQLAARYPTFAQALMTNRADGGPVIQATQNVGHVTGGIVTNIRIERLDFGTLSAERAFNQAVREPLEALCAAECPSQIVILVDALDEAILYNGADGIVSLLSRIESAPDIVRFLLTTRPTNQVLDPMRRIPLQEYVLSTGAGLKQSLDDVRRHVLRKISEVPELGQRLPPGIRADTFADVVQEKSRGNFLYVRYVLEMVRRQSAVFNLASLNNFPSDLDSIYHEFLSRLTSDPDKWHTNYARILGILSVAFEPLTKGLIAEFTSLPTSQVHTVLMILRQFLSVNDAPSERQRAHTVFHRSFADFLLDEDRAGVYWCDASEYHDRIAAYYFSKYHDQWHTCDGYGQSYLAFHINGAISNYMRLDVISDLKQLSDFILVSNPRSADAITQCILRIAHNLPHQPLALPFARWARGNWEAFHEPDAAVQSYEQALQGYQKVGDHLSVGRLYANLVGALTYANRVPEAQLAYEQASTILSMVGDQALYYLLGLEENYGFLLHQQQQYSNALKSYERAIELAVRLGESAVAIEVSVNKAVTLMWIGEFELSEAILQQARSEAEQQHQALTVARADRNLGQLYMLAGNKAEATRLLQTARVEFEALNNVFEVSEINELLAELTEPDNAATE